jgi:cysteine synthase B
VSHSRRRLLDAYGARVVLTPAEEGMDGAIEEARRRARSRPDLYFYGDQYNRAANWLAHYKGTGAEILQQTQGRVTHFTAGLGTTGTFTGAGRRLREALPGVRLVAVQPDSPLHALEGLKHLETVAHVPGIHDTALADRTEIVTTEEAQVMARRLARDEGLLVGPSSAAAAVAAMRTAESCDHGVVVTIFPDGAGRYLDDPFWRM